MELLLVLVVVIVAAATLFLAYAARRRFDTYERQLSKAEENEGRLSKVEENLAKLTKGQLDLENAAQAEDKAVMQRAQQVREELAERHETDMQTQTDKYEHAQKEISGVTQAISQLRGEVTAVFKGQGARLDSLVQQADDYGARLDSLDQLAAVHESHLGSLDQLAADFERSLDGLRADAAQLKTEAGQQAAALRALSDDTTSASERAAETLTGLNEQLLALAADVGQLDLHHHELRSCLRRWLAHSAQLARTSPATRVMPGFIQAERRAASQILPCLYDSFLEGVNLDFVFRERVGSAGVFYYLVSGWADDQSAEQRLGGLLRACQNSDAQLPGLVELRSLLLAMYVGGLGMMRIGPLFVSHSAEGRFNGIVLTDGEAETLDTGDLTSSPIRCVSLLSELPENRVLDLTDWAASNS